MSTTEQRTGFRLPWASDQDTNAQAAEPAAEAEAPPAEVEAVAVHAPAVEPAMPAMSSTARPNPLRTELLKAMQAAAAVARDEAIETLAADSKSRIETIHAESAAEAAELQKQADADIAGIREWSKAEVARIRDETDRKITARKDQLTGEVEDHAALVERRIERVQAAVTAFERRMEQFFAVLLAETDPTRLAGLADQLPEAPDLAHAQFDTSAYSAPAYAAPEPVADTYAQPEAEPEAHTYAQPEAEPEAHTYAQSDAEPEAQVPAAGSEWADLPSGFSNQTEQTAAAEAEALAQFDAEAIGDSDGSDDEADPAQMIPEDAVFARIAALQGAGTPNAEATESRLVVTGLVSVASIAGFKRVLSKVDGVTTVGVTSGPDGEFVFNVAHRPGLEIGSAIASLDGFDTQLVAYDDDTYHVSAHDRDDA